MLKKTVLVLSLCIQSVVGMGYMYSEDMYKEHEDELIKAQEKTYLKRMRKHIVAFYLKETPVPTSSVAKKIKKSAKETASKAIQNPDSKPTRRKFWRRKNRPLEVMESSLHVYAATMKTPREVYRGVDKDLEALNHRTNRTRGEIAGSEINTGTSRCTCSTGRKYGAM